MLTYLYVKTHNKTGLKYLGKTTSTNPHKYPGSGKYWTNHLKVHGKDYTTEILKECHSKEELKEWGLYYSDLWNIVKSNEWANLGLEEGNGGNFRSSWTADSIDKNRQSRENWRLIQIGKTYEELYGEEKSLKIKRSQSRSLRGRKLNITNEERENRSKRMKENNPSLHGISEKTIQKRVNTFKQNNCNRGNKNGMTTKPNSKLKISQANSKNHFLKHIITNEEIVVKNITNWAKNLGLNPSTVLCKFSRNEVVNNWIRIKSEK